MAKVACLQITKQLANLNIQKQIFHKDNQVVIDALHSKYGHLFSRDWNVSISLLFVALNLFINANVISHLTLYTRKAAEASAAITACTSLNSISFTNFSSQDHGNNGRAESSASTKI